LQLDPDCSRKSSFCSRALDSNHSVSEIFIEQRLTLGRVGTPD
jgi:hypothetical protein